MKTINSRSLFYGIEGLHDFLQFNLQLHKGKTRLIKFGRFATQNRNLQGKGKPETFDFLGFTHICGKTRKGKFVINRHSIGKRM